MMVFALFQSSERNHVHAGLKRPLTLPSAGFWPNERSPMHPKVFTREANNAAFTDLSGTMLY